MILSSFSYLTKKSQCNKFIILWMISESYHPVVQITFLKKIRVLLRGFAKSASLFFRCRTAKFLVLPSQLDTHETMIFDTFIETIYFFYLLRKHIICLFH